jgi:sugar/nucleoside kinase (ribokinase family)
LSASANTVRARLRSPFQPRGLKFPSKAILAPLPRASSIAARNRPSPEATVERLQAFGIAEIVVKNGPSSALVAADGKREHVPVPEVVVPVDLTAAGDGFNAGYLAARLSGRAPIEAAAAAHRLAGEVIRHRGALLPRAGAAMH